MNKLIRSEWIKLRSLRTTWILAVLAVLTAMAITGAATGSIKADTSAFERVDLLLTPAPLLVRLFILVSGHHGVLERVSLRHDHAEPRCGSDPW